MFIILCFHSSASSEKMYVQLYSQPIEIDEEMIKREAVDKSSLTINGITIGEHDLNIVRKVFGESPILFDKDEKHAPASICYKSEHKDQELYLVFVGYSPESPSLISFILTSDIQYNSSGVSCTESPLIDSSLKTESGIHLGMDVDGLMNILGAPSRVIEDSPAIANFKKEKEVNIYYMYVLKEFVDDNNTADKSENNKEKITASYFNLNSNIHAVFKGNKLVTISIDRFYD